MMTSEKTIAQLKAKGYQVEKLTPYQYRIECVLDLYVIRFRWHNIATNNRGSWHGMKIENLCHFIDQQVAIADAILDREIAAGNIAEDGATVAAGKHDVDSAIWWTRKGLEKRKINKS